VGLGVGSYGAAGLGSGVGLAVEEVTEALAVDKDGIHVCCVLEVSKVLLGLALGLGLGLGLRFGLGSGSGQVGVPRGEKNTRPNPNPSQPPLTCSRSRGSDETCTACPMKLALRMAARVCRVRMYGEWKKRTVSLPGAPHGHGSTYTRHAVRTARLSLVRVRRRVQYVEPRGRLPCA
jgi:hypothetical protein